MVNILSPVSSWGTLAIEILEPDSRRISVILDPARPMMQPTMSDGIEMFCVLNEGSRGAPPAAGAGAEAAARADWAGFCCCCWKAAWSAPF